MHTKTSMATLRDRFTKAPYGFIEDDVAWLVAVLFRRGDITLSMSGAQITLMNRSTDEIVRFLTKKEYVDKLLTEHRRHRSLAELNAAREALKYLFGKNTNVDDEDLLLTLFHKQSARMEEGLDDLIRTDYRRHTYPGRGFVETGYRILDHLLRQPPRRLLPRTPQRKRKTSPSKSSHRQPHGASRVNRTSTAASKPSEHASKKPSTRTPSSTSNSKGNP